MKVAVFSTEPYDEQFLAQANQACHQHELAFLEQLAAGGTRAVAKMKKGVMLINTSRGTMVDTAANGST